MKSQWKYKKTGVENNGNRVENKKKLLKKIIVKMKLKQEGDKEGIIIEALLDSEAIELVMSSEFVKKKNKFKKILNR